MSNQNTINTNELTHRIINMQTGEFKDIYENDNIDIKLTSQKQKDAIKKEKQSQEADKQMVEWNKQLGGFIFVLFKYSEPLNRHPELTQSDITRLFYMATYVDYNGYLYKDSNYINKEEFKEMLGLHRSKFDPFFSKLKDLKIIEYNDKNTDSNKKIKINKEYFLKGEIPKDIEKNYNHTRVYIDTIRYLYENVRQKQHKQLGAYFKMIPYIHRQYNTLCWNPDDNVKDIKLMNVRELQNILGYHRNGVSKIIRDLLKVKLKSGGSIVGFFRTEYDEGKSYIIINPKVFYGGNFMLDENGHNKKPIIKWFGR